MKKVVFSFCFVITVCIVLLSTDSLPSGISFYHTFDFKNNKLEEYDTKYSDCIHDTDLSQFSPVDISQLLKKQPTLHKEMNRCLSQYKNTLDDTIKNLNTLDSHEFLHKEYQRSKNKISNNSLSEIKTYYHLGIMRICYEKDKELNLISSNSIAKVLKREGGNSIEIPPFPIDFKR
ncbi:hypothetical protein LV716_11960 [Flagellimonas sp. HMM57]|uniref:hypothetical protein n=1 Tax=unclassified Flagellimonas TaxID=2644544 RepID=UPI0013D29452|nr:MULTISPECIES: hypothetical protein [unclassified Flagellimonas]UII74972.1 hypothetical protein LV716_11960 [Flagellimonas sp. HMM57]